LVHVTGTLGQAALALFAGTLDNARLSATLEVRNPFIKQGMEVGVTGQQEVKTFDRNGSR
jgi:hypothetical protein